MEVEHRSASDPSSQSFNDINAYGPGTRDISYANTLGRR